MAVLDDAVELTHPALVSNVVPGSKSFRPGNLTNLPLPCLSTVDSHGTAVAGIILAKDTDNIGISGVAPSASLVSYDILSSKIETDLYEALTFDNQRVAIYHNSWAGPNDGAINNIGTLFPKAIRQGIDQGRQGLGSIFVFASGNGGSSDNSNLDGFINQRGIITVCAVDDRGSKLVSSEPGTNILLCAPGAGKKFNIVTTGLQGTYRNDFSGSSAAAPMVSGVIALMLSVRPDLTWRDVQLILAKTARKNDSFNRDWKKAKGGSGWVHPFYGYGVVNAEAAVNLSQTWHSVGTSQQQKICSFVSKEVDQFIEEFTVSPKIFTANINCPDISRIEFIELEIFTTHKNPADLRIDLETPEGYTSRLVDIGNCSACNQNTKWNFVSVHHLDETANGEFKLKILDGRPQNSGTLNSWQLTIYGR